MLSDDIQSAYHRTKWALAVRGLFSLAIGILILARPVASVAVFALVIALWALIDGIVRIVHAFDLKSVAPHWWVLLLAGLVSAGFGAAALYYYPALSLAFAVAWAGLWLITGGAFTAYFALQERRMQLPWGWTMTFGALAIVLGVAAVAYPGATLASIMGLISAFAIIGGIALLIAAWKMQSLKRDVSRTIEERKETTRKYRDVA
jgi:uncharacterized membrane protein HdeD (DUF308 family)